MFSRRQFVFYLIFLVLFFFCILLGETPFGICVWGAMGVSYLVYMLTSNDKTMKIHRYNQFAIITFIGFWVTTFLSLFFTTNLSETANKWILMSVSLLTFIFFSLEDKDMLSIEFFLYGYLMICLSLGVLGDIFYFLPMLSKKLPDLNLLYSNFGHNHAAIIYLFGIPIAFFLAKKFRFSWASWLPLIFLFLSLLLTFARFDIVMAIEEVVMLLFVHFFPKKWKIIGYGGMISLFCIILLLAGVATYSWQVCSFTSVNHQVCKDFKTEFRIQYFREALQGIQQKPWFGWGGGTFSAVSYEFADMPYYYSSYAHNEYVQLLTEYGIVLSLPFFAFLGLLFWNIQSEFRKLDFNRARTYLILGMLGIFANALVDFNWTFSAVWFLLIVSSALFLRDRVRAHTFVLFRIPSKIFSLVIKICTAMAFLILEICVIAYLISSVIWYQGNHEKSIQIYPLVYWRVQTAAAEVKDFSHILYWYPNDLSALSGLLLNSNVSDSEKVFLLQKILVIDPLNFAKKISLLDLAQRTQNWPVYEATLENINHTYSGTKKTLISYEDEQTFFDHSVADINRLSVTDLSFSSQMYLSLSQFDRWLAIKKPFLPWKNPDSYPANELKDTFDQFSITEVLSANSAILTTWLNEQIQREISQSNWEQVTLDIRRELRLNPDNRWPLSKLLVESSTQLMLSQTEITQQQQTLDQWFKNWRLLMGSNFAGKTYFAEDKVLFENLVMAGKQAYLRGDVKLTIKNYQNAEQVMPQAQKVSSLTEIKKQLQVRANQYLTQNNWGMTEQTLQIMAAVFVDDYAGSAQLGNYYLLRGNYPAAETFYQMCLGNFPNRVRETSCYWGNEDLQYHLNHQSEKIDPSQTQYWKVSQLILSEN